MEKYPRNKDGYRKRKLRERLFENAEKRSLKCYYQKDKEKGMKLYSCAHNIPTDSMVIHLEMVLENERRIKSINPSS